MSTWVGILIILGVDAIVVALMLEVRRRAPEGSYYTDTQQAAGVFAVVGTAFAVVLAFVFLLAFQSFDRARTSSAAEAEATVSMFRTADLFPDEARDVLQNELICYGRAVIHLEWPAMDHRRESPVVQRWVASLTKSFDTLPGGNQGDKASAAYDAWFAGSSDRMDGRQGRLDEAQPFIPRLVWIVLIGSGALVIGFVCLFADRKERRVAQAALALGVSTVIVSGLVMVGFFDSPYYDGPDNVRPAAMQRSIDQVMLPGRDENNSTRPLPCDAQGRPT